MSIKQAAWIHGTSVQLENSSWSNLALRQGFFTTLRPSNESTSGWVHFAIPTPVIVNDARLRAHSALIRFTTGRQASIGAIHIFDGEKKIHERNGLNLQGTLQLVREPISKSQRVHWGTGVSILVNFNDGSSDAFIQLIGAGIDFI